MNPDKFERKQVLALTACMLSVAQVDGVHAAEEALIAGFYAEQREPGMPELAEVVKSLEDAAFLPGLAGDAEFAETLLRMCLMAGYADGHLSPPELARIEAIAAAVKVDAARLQTLRVEVKDRFVSAFSHLPVAESVADVAKGM